MLPTSSVFQAFNFEGGRVVMGRGKVNQNGDKRGKTGGGQKAGNV